MNSRADEIRPGYLQIKETPADTFSVVWKVPAKGDRVLGLDILLPDNCTESTSATREKLNAAVIQRQMVHCDGGLNGREISVEGLKTSSTDVLMHLEQLGRDTQIVQLTPTAPSYTVRATTSRLQVVQTYTWLGITHILEGIDHLLFVLALLLIVRGWKRLVATITAFTLAHSLTLAMATLDIWRLPQAPVEAVIAMSIVFLAAEWVRGEQGKPGAAARWPWLIAFLFGLLHGFGFAGALAEVGLPPESIPLALVFFNVGVEIGQLLFVATLLLINQVLIRQFSTRLVTQMETILIYGVGSVASMWMIQRISGFWS